MLEKQTKVVVDVSKPKGQREQIVELTPAEIENLESRAEASRQQRLAEEQAQAEKAAARKSAEEKLAALGLTPEEISAMLG